MAADAKPEDKSGWVIEIQGYHFYNKYPATAGPAHVRNTLIKNLQEGKVRLPVSYSDQSKFEDFSMSELGIGYVILAADKEYDRYFKIPNDDWIDPTAASGKAGDVGFAPMPKDKKDKVAVDKDNPPEWTVPKYTFVIQFVWKEKLLRQRLEDREKKRLAEVRAAEEAAAAAANTPAVPGT